jgi:hypothetical protein
MAIQSTKHPAQFTISMQNIMGGLCLLANPESIPDGTLAQMDNWEYGIYLNQPQVVPGIAPLFDMTINADTIFYDTIHSVWLASSGTNLYTTDLSTKTLIGALTGIYKPIYALYDTYVLIASGGQIQKWDGTTLTTIVTSPLSHWVANRSGRVEAYNINSDVKNYSAIGDINGWTNNTSDISSAQFVDVGYKDASQIACTIPLATDSIVIKTSGTVYRVISENDFTNISVVQAAQKTNAYNQYSGLALMNKAFFVGIEGFNSFSTVTDYGAVKVDDPSPGYMVNGWLSHHIDSTSRMWHLPSRKQVWCKTSNQNEVLIYHYTLNTWSRRYFKYPLRDVATIGTDVYIGYGTKIGKLDDTIGTDDGYDMQAIMASKRYLPKRKKYLMKRVNFITHNILLGDLVMSVGGKIFPVDFTKPSGDIAIEDDDIAIEDSDPVVSNNFSTIRKRTRKRTSAVQVIITVRSGRTAIRDLSIDVVEVGS